MLEPGGTLRLALPDMEKAIRAYLDRDAGYFLIPDDDVRSLGGKMIVQLTWYGYSRSMFTFDYIEELLYGAGFVHVSPATSSRRRARTRGSSSSTTASGRASSSRP